MKPDAAHFVENDQHTEWPPAPGILALDSVSLGVETGTVLGIIGPNGSGKTTLLNVMSGLLRPTSGSVRLRGRPVEALQPHRLARLGVGRTFQIPRVFAQLTVFENLSVPWAAARRPGRDARAETKIGRAHV